MWPNPQEPADLVTFTEEILNGKLQFLCSDKTINWCLWVFLPSSIGNNSFYWHERKGLLQSHMIIHKWRYQYHLNNRMKIVRIRSFSGPFFAAFGLNTERYSVSLNTDTFHVVNNTELNWRLLQILQLKISTHSTSYKRFVAVYHLILQQWRHQYLFN